MAILRYIVLLLISLVINEVGGHVLNTIAVRARPIKKGENAYNYHYETHYYKQKVDHFGFTNTDIYSQRYLISKRHWSAGGPIFFYTGNEGDITWFCNNTGFMWDIAPQFDAMLVFAEHRYYGQSLPYGNKSYTSPKYTDYLTSEQALADFVELIFYLKSSISGAQHSRVVAFGGSYGGMLSAWLRLKYPGAVVGSIAASAPIWMFPDMTPCGAFRQTTTNTFKKASPLCAQNIRASWKALYDAATTAQGRTFISTTFHLCKPLKTFNEMFDLRNWLDSVYANLAMVDYPYPASFLEPLPAWPVKAVCKELSDRVYTANDLLNHLSLAVEVYYNYTGNAKCLDMTQDSTASTAEIGWGYQECTEMTAPMCADGIHDMFEPYQWNSTLWADGCYKKWGVKPRRHWSQHHYGGRKLQFASNIVFSNGLLDPWSALGVNVSYPPSVLSLIIPEGAHHLDLRASNKLDPISLIAVREKEKNAITRWINEEI